MIEFLRNYCKDKPHIRGAFISNSKNDPEYQGQPLWTVVISLVHVYIWCEFSENRSIFFNDLLSRQCVMEGQI